MPDVCPLSVAVHHDEFAVRLELNGDLDMQTGPLLLSAIDSLLPPADGPVVLDCSTLRFIDARGLSALLRAHAALAASGRDLGLMNPSDALRRILTATGLNDTLPEMRRPPVG
ncbi:STAS domain-containing protein [Cryptosporangium sp. NPDC048952]|uniref:STAS domain-containing protein n=1 Tax=Cryptosporangium sp. NPDC048952 TaxID=3363961 RepID=UPI003721BA06